jgi:protein phosphatase
MSMAAAGTSLRVGVVTTRGNVRRRNEDNFYVPGRPSLQNGTPVGTGSYPGLLGGAAGAFPPPNGPLDSSSEISDYSDPGPAGLFIVADGMGGQQAGERASQLAVELIPREFKRRLPGAVDEKDLIRVVREGVAAANAEIVAQSNVHPDFANMGSTVCLVLFSAGRAFVTGIGDSRVYLLRSNEIKQLTKDHSLANALEEAGSISADEVETHRYKHILYLYLGTKDVGEGPEEVKVVEYLPGDQFLLATDGLTGVVRDDVIADLLRNASDPQRGAQALVNRALENQSKDNITCVVVQVVAAP